MKIGDKYICNWSKKIIEIIGIYKCIITYKDKEFNISVFLNSFNKDFTSMLVFRENKLNKILE